MLQNSAFRCSPRHFYADIVGARERKNKRIRHISLSSTGGLLGLHFRKTWKKGMFNMPFSLSIVYSTSTCSGAVVAVVLKAIAFLPSYRIPAALHFKGSFFVVFYFIICPMFSLDYTSNLQACQFRLNPDNFTMEPCKFNMH